MFPQFLDFTPTDSTPIPSQAVVVSLPSIESSFATHTTASIKGWDHDEAAVLMLACEVLDGAESFLWVRFSILEQFVVRCAYLST